MLVQFLSIASSILTLVHMIFIYCRTKAMMSLNFFKYFHFFSNTPNARSGYFYMGNSGIYIIGVMPHVN